MDQIVDRLADKGVVGERRAEKVIAIDDGAAGRCEMVRRTGSLKRGSVRLMG